MLHQAVIARSARREGALNSRLGSLLRSSASTPTPTHSKAAGIQSQQNNELKKHYTSSSRHPDRDSTTLSRHHRESESSAVGKLGQEVIDRVSGVRPFVAGPSLFFFLSLSF